MVGGVYLSNNNLSIRNWLKNNGYEDVLKLIDETMLEWQIRGVKTRRNWWDVLSGDKQGRPRKIHGKEFPVLKGAQIRKGMKISIYAICRNDKEEIPEKWNYGRWKNN